ncbi:Hpt domain-containing protein [Paenibacillus sp. UNC451MF]|uniref:Hpt domain-containing protein n=1 Tax=Paenibacillus sp. UNC451MF TaxID=1449063 RepID=UPI0004914F09|nr:Hpt domain-containing protein [Paenibacillus sp. UNC451MF]
MSEQDHERMQRILSKTKELFLRDAHSRTDVLLTAIALWEQKEVRHQELVDRVYAFAHSLKGLAYTVGCYEVHHLSEQIDSYSIQHSGAWTELSVNELMAQVHELLAELEREWRKAGLVAEGTA